MERDFFYDPGLHGADWNAVYARYAPLVPYVRHRADLTYILDQVGGELSVTASWEAAISRRWIPPAPGSWAPTWCPRASAGDRPDLHRESWNPELRAPLDAPGSGSGPASTSWR